MPGSEPDFRNIHGLPYTLGYAECECISRVDRAWGLNVTPDNYEVCTGFAFRSLGAGWATYIQLE